MVDANGLPRSWGTLDLMSEATNSTNVSPTGEFNRDQRYISTRITADGRDGYPVEPGRYRLVVSRACPWANRSVIVRRLSSAPRACCLPRMFHRWSAA